MNIEDTDVEALIKAVREWWARIKARSGPAAGLTPTFVEEFAALDFSVWDSVPLVNDPAANGSSLPGNSERQWHINHRYAPTAKLRPWRIENGELVITADRTPAWVRPFVGYGPQNNPQLQAEFGPAFYDFTSGRLSTNRAFSQTYGYFECEAKLPAGRGLWPAFWMLPTDMSWPPEIDVFEVLGHDPRTIYQTLHWNDPPTPQGAHKSDHVATTDFDASAGFHRYGVMWTPKMVAFYLDGVLRREFPTPPQMNRPMHLILNLAVGGSWPGDPDAATAFPAEMRVRSVRAWKLPA